MNCLKGKINNLQNKIKNIYQKIKKYSQKYKIEIGGILFLMIVIISSIIEKSYFNTNYIKKWMTIIIPVIGWYLVFRINIKMIKEDKKIEIYEDIKPIFAEINNISYNLNRSIGEFINYLYKTEKDKLDYRTKKMELDKKNLRKIDEFLNDIKNKKEKLIYEHNKLIDKQYENQFILQKFNFKNTGLKLKEFRKEFNKQSSDMESKIKEINCAKNNIVTTEDIDEIVEIDKIRQKLGKYYESIQKLNDNIQKYTFKDLF